MLTVIGKVIRSSPLRVQEIMGRFRSRFRLWGTVRDAKRALFIKKRTREILAFRPLYWSPPGVSPDPGYTRPLARRAWLLQQQLRRNTYSFRCPCSSCSSSSSNSNNSGGAAACIAAATASSSSSGATTTAGPPPGCTNIIQWLLDHTR